MTKPQTRFTFDAEIWEHDGMAAWFFVSLPEPIADEIEGTFGQHARGFGSLRVEVTIGDTVWRTSIFPDDKRGTYVLPIKKQVRKAEDLADGTGTTVTIELIDD